MVHFFLMYAFLLLNLVNCRNSSVSSNKPEGLNTNHKKNSQNFVCFCDVIGVPCVVIIAIYVSPNIYIMHNMKVRGAKKRITIFFTKEVFISMSR